jgi:transposase
VQRQESRAQASWEQKCWHFSNRRFACEADARAAIERELKEKPVWLDVQSDLVAHAQYAGKGRPRKDASPTSQQWQIMATVSVKQEQVAQEAFRKACWIVGTNVLDPVVLSDQQLVTTYKGQGARGFRFLKDPLFLALSVTVKKPERIMALSFIMVFCLLVYRLAEFRLRSRLAQTQQTIPDQVQKPTARPTMRLSSFNVLKALNCFTCRLLQLPLPSCYVFSQFIGSFYSS